LRLDAHTCRRTFIVLGPASPLGLVVVVGRRTVSWFQVLFVRV
jgi:hypothetical protein